MTICRNVSRSMNLAVIFSLDLESQYKLNISLQILKEGMLRQVIHCNNINEQKFYL